jgi:Sec-independent protein translocase protein TatA
MFKKREKTKKLLHNSKSQGISINTIIIAAIALIVLVVLVMIFTGRMGTFGVGIDKTTGAAMSCNVQFANSLGKDRAEIMEGPQQTTETKCKTRNGKAYETKDTIDDPNKICCVI